MLKKTGILLCSTLIGIHVAQAEVEDKNLTALTLGVESVQYSENTGAGITSSGNRMNNMIQRSSSYTAVSDDFGFYITTTSTLIVNANSEAWTMSPYGTVQTNQRKVTLTDIALDTAWNLNETTQFTAGLGMNTMSFSRSGFNYPQGTQGVITTNPTTGQVLTFTADPNGPIQQLTAAGGYLARQPGAVFEDCTSILANVGVRYDSFFSGNDGLRIFGGVRTGLPLFYYVTNSNYPNTSWTNAFQGFNIHADAGVGFQVKDNFDFVLLGAADYRYRPATKSTATGAFVPNVTVTMFRTTAGLSWSY